MSGRLFHSIFNSVLTLQKTSTSNLRTFHTASVAYAARKGTRAKARAKKVKVEITKVGFIPHNQRVKNKASKSTVEIRLDDFYKHIAVDDVYPMKYFRWTLYKPEDVVKMFQETHHPTMYNVPDALVYAQVEFNMQAVKQTRYLDDFTRLTLLPHYFPREEERSILVFCKGQELTREASEAGASLVGGTELVKKIQEGEIKLSDFDYILAHPGIITDLVPIRGLLKRRFPTVKTGTLDPNVGDLVRKFAAGVQYRVTKNEQMQSFGKVEVPVGRLNMEPTQVAENVKKLLEDLQAIRPKRDGLFITRCYMVCPPGTEVFKIDPFAYVDKTLAKEVQDDSDDEQDTPAVANA